MPDSAQTAAARETASPTLAVIPGDGIGPEVTAEALKVLEVASPVKFEPTRYDLGAERYLATGEVLPDSVLAEIREHDAILLGAVGGKPNDPNLPRLARPTAIAFDAKRRRLVVAAMALPDILLFAYDADAGKWSVLINLEGVALNGLSYSPADDCFYGVPTFLGRQGVVIRLTPEGDANQIIIPSRPIGSATRTRPRA